MKILFIPLKVRLACYSVTDEYSRFMHFHTLDKILQPIPALIRWELNDFRTEYKDAPN